MIRSIRETGGAQPPPGDAEAHRLDVLRSYALLDTPPERSFDDLARLAALVCGTRSAVVTLIDEHRQWFKARHEFSLSETERAVAFCSHTIEQTEPLLIVDATKDPRFANNPLVTADGGLRFYAGVPLRTAQGEAMGALAVLDRVPRTLSDDQVEMLKLLGGQAMALMDLHRERTRRAMQEHDLRSAHETLDFHIINSPLAVIEWDRDFRVVRWSPRAQEMFGWREDEVLGCHPTEWSSQWSFVHIDDAEAVDAKMKDLLQGLLPRNISVNRNLTRDSEVVHCEWYNSVRLDETGGLNSIFSLVHDVSERSRLDAQLAQREQQLHRAQKLEAVGQLTGGIAHDFGNLLTVILCNAELLHDELGDNDRLRRLAGMITTAGRRGSELTHRLLAFAGQQMLEPRPVNLGSQIASMHGMLRRTLGEHISIELRGGAGQWSALIDPGQFESALLNLCLNSRDVMTDTGVLTISSGNVVVGPTHAAVQEGLAPGEYVLVAVTDTGAGIADEVLPHVFEPFFTTKPQGKGTGLGLSMVHGFASQSGGHVLIRSQPGHGTTVEMYLPRAASQAGADAGQAMEALPGGAETVLLVEDDELVRRFAMSQLVSLGYRVFQAGDGPEALQLLARHPDIELLFTDVVMPGGMNGRQLAEKALARRPGLKVLYTSGYSADVLVHDGRVAPGVTLLAKPYGRQELAQKVRMTLDARQPAAPADGTGRDAKTAHYR
ncbi:MAG: response regulator [Gammaproteobacteria bacterium]|nr:response regulator [Gammaproteobacteria bacterium]